MFFQGMKEAAAFKKQLSVRRGELTDRRAFSVILMVTVDGRVRGQIALEPLLARPIEERLFGWNG